jgi:predicted TIM-barrel fold metal-dependent hydrolase
MAYKRKTEDVWIILQHCGEGWEEVSAESSWKDTRRALAEYRENQPEYPVKAKKTRMKLETAAKEYILEPA